MQRKKKTCVILFAVFCLLPVSTVFAQTTLLGDVDEDGVIGILDALKVARYYVGMSSLPNPANADVTGDGIIDILDALLIAQFSVKLIDCFPVGPTPTAQPTIPPKGTPPLPPPVPERTVPYLEEFQLSYGEVVQAAVSNIIIKFSDVADSRCPLDVLCSWEGEVTITLEVWTETAYLGTVQVKAPPARETSGSVSNPVNSYLYMFECSAVDPYPATAAEPPAPEEYVATLKHIMAVP